MIKRLVLASSLLLLVACGKEEPPPKLVTVENAEIIDTDAKSCVKVCYYYITVKKGETKLKMDTTKEIAKAVSKGSKVHVTYNPNTLEAVKVSFPDFESKEAK